MNTRELADHPAFSRVRAEQFSSMNSMWVNDVDIKIAAEDMCLPIELLRLWYAAMDMQFYENNGLFPSQISDFNS